MTEERIIFMGTPEFAVATLEALVRDDADIVGVITAPDRKAGRGMKLQPSAVKKFALDNGLNVLQPANLKSDEFLNELKSLEATLQVVVAFRMLPKAVWSMPQKGTVNLHASLLPQYRGAAPINWAIINGEKETGVTTFFIRQQIDTGNIIYQEKMPIGEDETAGELHDRLMEAGAGLIVRTVKAISDGDNPSKPQSPVQTGGKDAPKLFKADCRIDWKRPAAEIFNLIRGLSPYPAAFTIISDGTDEYSMRIFRAFISEEDDPDTPYGSIRADDGHLYVMCADRRLGISELQLAGRKRMSAKDFLLGFEVSGYSAS